jgi:hypothetical protein
MTAYHIVYKVLGGVLGRSADISAKSSLFSINKNRAHAGSSIFTDCENACDVDLFQFTDQRRASFILANAPYKSRSTAITLV